MPETSTERATKTTVAGAISRGHLDPMEKLPNVLIRQARKDVDVGGGTKVLSIND